MRRIRAVLRAAAAKRKQSRAEVRCPTASVDNLRRCPQPIIYNRYKITLINKRN